MAPSEASKPGRFLLAGPPTAGKSLEFSAEEATMNIGRGPDGDFLEQVIAYAADALISLCASPSSSPALLGAASTFGGRTLWRPIGVMDNSIAPSPTLTNSVISTRLRIAVRCITLSAAAIVVVSGASAPRAAAIDAWQVAVGYDALLSHAGGNVPLGAGVSVGIVEASQPTTGEYMVDGANSEFSAAGDPFAQVATFTNVTNTNVTPSLHATTVAQTIVGNTLGLAKGADQVNVWQADNWLSSQLQFNSTSDPVAQTDKVQNHSWVGSFGNNPNDLSALRRFDYLIETGELTEVVGTNNNDAANPGQAHPNLMAHSYNGIVVGRTDGKHSRGLTGTVGGAGTGIAYGAGRVKPDIVGPSPFTSYATAMVSSAATILRGAAVGTDADRSETMKAILMAGATKQEFNGWDDPATPAVDPRNWTHTQTRPLDAVFGAGELNVFNSYRMTNGGRSAGSTTQPATAAKHFGWDYQNRKTDAAVGDIYYNFEVPAGSTAPELSIMLAWNVKVTDTNPAEGTFSPQESLQNLDLQFFDSTASFLGSMLDQSVSTVDNVEHIYRTNLGPGTYTLKVSGAANWDYGLAWRMSTLFDQPDADFDEDGMITGSDFLLWQRNLGKLVDALHTDGDANGDGMVDAADLSLLYAGIVPAQVAAVRQAAAQLAGGGAASGAGVEGVPEPAAIVSTLLAVGFSVAAVRRVRPRRSI
jgi:hypothetical protein